LRNPKIFLLILLSLILLLHYCPLGFSSPEGDKAEPPAENPSTEEDIAPILVALIIILLAAKMGGDLCERIRQPAVLGELVFGVLLGNFYLTGLHWFEPLKHHITINVLAQIGVIILLFQVGLESNVEQMMSVGLSSFLVATFGVITPFFLGWGVSSLFMPQASAFIHIFVGATLTATSVGITARVLQDLQKITTKEARIILGAAVIDDIMGLIILSVAVGIITAANAGEASLHPSQILIIIGKAVFFLLGALALGGILSRGMFAIALRSKARGLLITVALLFCFLLAYVASRIGLAPIVGAFAAGLILDEVHYRRFLERGEHRIEELLQPISNFLVPIFFVHMGMRVDLASFGNLGIIGFAGVLTLAAILGKQVCSLGVYERGLNRWAVGVGMIPRGEVGLIFAGIGSQMVLGGVPVIDQNVFSAVVIMVIVTTLITPPFLKLVFAHGGDSQNKGKKQTQELNHQLKAPQE
jgi:Kef-type K+ transport system membrane component KefB